MHIELTYHKLIDENFTYYSQSPDASLSERPIWIYKYMLFSIDLDSLFTNVSLHETVDYSYDFISSSNISLRILVDYVREFIILRTPPIRFDFKGTIYRLIDEMWMGNPLGPLLADTFLSLIEIKFYFQLGFIQTICWWYSQFYWFYKFCLHFRSFHSFIFR